MKKILIDIILCLPLMGIIMSYLFILAGILSGIYPNDPTELAGELFYSVYMNIYGICMLMVPIGGIYLMYSFIRKKINQLNKIFIYLYIIGASLFALSVLFDPGYYLTWFAD